MPSRYRIWLLTHNLDLIAWSAAIALALVVFGVVWFLVE